MTFEDIVDLAEKAGCDVSAMDKREYQTMWCDSSQLEHFAASLIQAGAASRDAEVAELNRQVEENAKWMKLFREQRDQLQREVAELKSKLFDLTKQRDALSRMADSLEQERDQLHEQVAMLRIALFVIQDNSDDIGVIERAIEALEKTEPK